MAPDQALHNIGEMMQQEGLITEKQLLAAQQTQRETDQPLGRILVEMGLISEKVKMDFLHKKTGFELVDLDRETIDPAILKLLDRTIAQKHHIVPVRLGRDGLVLAVEDPTDIVLLDHIEEVVKMKVQPVIAGVGAIESVLERYQELEPGAETGKQPLYLRRPLWYRVCEYLFMPLFVLGPVLTLALLFYFNEDVQHMLEARDAAYDRFEVFLFALLGLGLWGVIIFELDGFLFKRAQRPVVESPQNET